ncbi:MAG: HD domain-containing protein [Lachnospiraceae bacterium]|nr:HD domain-containing protein [Lachnospiraceae bacterium]
MVVSYYMTLFIASLILTLVFVLIWHKHVDVYYPLVFTLIPISNLGYLMMAMASNLEEAILANKVTYLGGCFLPLIFLLNTLNLCGIRFKKPIPVGILGFGILQFLCVLTIGYSPLYYRSVSFAVVEGVPVLTKVYGPMHALLYLNVFGCLLGAVGLMIYAMLSKRRVSIKNVLWLLSAETTTVLAFMLGRMIHVAVDWTPAMYVATQGILIGLTKRLCLYDISETIVDNVVERGDYGFISLDLHQRLLDCNDTALNYIPELQTMSVDHSFDGECEIFDQFSQWFAEADGQEKHRKDVKVEKLYPLNNRIYQFTVEHFYHHRKKVGYQIRISDETEQQQYIKLLNHYNEQLEQEVAVKTEHIGMMQDKLILGMADMVESRDFSTGGHIKRTSHVVRILAKELERLGTYSVPSDFYRNLIKAAPMHDLGKLSIDDAILRKPGNFTEDEFELMKDHAAKGAQLLVKVLDGIEDEAFEQVAVNVAHYHHEKWDGTGYPEHLAGEQIPLEARIMAVADVYDALISKRYYKEGMSAQEAFEILHQGMGTQFDPKLEPAVNRSRAALEAYYEQEKTAQV